ncbi:hypothetical protein [Gloeocapsopsis dulcis]|nr:hypothetical protein [Gloeocapsopsis dulcis]
MYNVEIMNRKEVTLQLPNNHGLNYAWHCLKRLQEKALTASKV